MRKIANFLGVDHAVFFTLLSRVWNVGAGLVTLGFIARSLSPEEQGYYYTFNSLIALQIFAELGLNFAIVQFASHEMAQLTWQQDGTVTGSPQAKRRLQSLIQFSLAWFGVAALVMLLLLVPAGLFFFSNGETGTIANSSLVASWVLLVTLTAINLFIGMASAFLEGCGKVTQVAKMRLWQSVLAASMVWLVLGQGGNLLALPASSLVMATVGMVWLSNYHYAFFKDLLTYRTGLLGMSWRVEIWPFQWRIALSYASGFLIFQIYNPFLFKTVGPVAAGQMGMSMQIFAAINGAAIVWITTKVPQYGQLIATGQRQQLNALFFRGFLQSTIFLLLCLATLWILIYSLADSGLIYSERLLPLSLLTILCFSSLANHIISAQASYLRAHKLEPFMFISVVGGLICLVTAYLLIPIYGLSGAVISYVAPTLLIGLPVGSYIFFSKRQQ